MVTHINDRMEKLTGYSRSEVVGRMTCGALLNTVQCDTCDCVLKQVMEHKKAHFRAAAGGAGPATAGRSR